MERGAKLVSNVRKLSAIENLKEDLHSIKLLSVINDAVSSIKKAFPQKQLKIDIKMHDKSVVVLANDLLLDVFEILLFNAKMYNNNSSIEILIFVSKQDDSIRIECRDNGMGIIQSQKQEIFQRGKCERKSTGGIGLGLSLVNKIISSYSGKIWIEDRIKGDYTKGSNFILLIPEAV